MDAAEFVKNWHDLKEGLVFDAISGDGNTEVSVVIQDLKLDPIQTAKLRAVLDGILTDAMYSLLLGLDGAASIGRGEQQRFEIRDDQGNIISPDGELEAEAWECFHGSA